MSHYHAVVWLDHPEARIFQFNRDEVDRVLIRPHEPGVHLHHHAGSNTDGRSPEDQAYYGRIAAALAGSKAILVVGPAQAKLEFLKHAMRCDREIANAVVGLETVDHPTDGELMAYARSYFGPADRMLPQIS
jgi:hypothetical protein